MRIASLLPNATEIAFAIGAGEEVVGISHACDYPMPVQSLPVLTGPAADTSALSQREIDRAISAFLEAGTSTYFVDLPLLRSLNPDLILTQTLCDVCAVSAGAVHRTVHEAELGAHVLTLQPLSLEGVFRSIEEVGDACGHAEAGRRLVTTLWDRYNAVRASTSGSRPRVLTLEWLDPLFVGGH